MNRSAGQVAPVGVFGGTFDPVHFGHLRPALEVLEGLALAEVRLIPCRIPPHRDLPGATPEQRWAMLTAAVQGQSGLVPDDRELRREGPSYMVDTLASLRGEFSDRPLCLILGLDAFLGLPTWHRWRELLDLAHLVVMSRPGARLPGDGEMAELAVARRVTGPAALNERSNGGILFHEVTQLDISATSIRALTRTGRSARYLLPDVVWTMIKDRGLYRAAEAATE